MQIKCTICDKNKRQIKDGKTSHFNENVMYSIQSSFISHQKRHYRWSESGSSGAFKKTIKIYMYLNIWILYRGLQSMNTTC